MAIDQQLFAPPTKLQRIVRKSAEITLARLGVGRAFAAIPLFRRLYTKRILERRDHTGLYSGVYRTYAEALADVPPNRLVGWDHEESAKLWLHQIDPVRLSTYPVFFWLQRLVTDGSALVDVGGSIGSTYYGYRRYATFPSSATWTVVEMPKIAEQGVAVARRQEASHLRFLHELAQVQHCDFLLAAGALQYMEHAIPGLLEALPAKPRYLLLNKLPITHQGSCWTLQNYGPAITPQQLFNESDFLAYFDRHGYRLRDRWAVDDLDCLIPFHPERFIKQFSGFLFELGG